MNRNEDRFSAPGAVPDEGTPTAAHSSAPETPGFNLSVPTEFVNLPSQGRFYPEGHPLHGVTSVEIRYMTAKEEDILTSQALIKKGVAIERLLQNVLVDNSFGVNDLLIGDKNALLVATRITGYGAEYTTNVTCPSCNNTDEHTFDLQDGEMTNVEEAVAGFGGTLTEQNTFLITLPMTDATVECRLLNGADELRLQKEGERKARRNIDESSLTDQFRAFIVSVNGDTSPITIASFIQAMPARDSRMLRGFYSAIVPSVDLTQHYNCTSCGYEADMEVPLTVDFFWPK